MWKILTKRLSQVIGGEVLMNAILNKTICTYSIVFDAPEKIKCSQSLLTNCVVGNTQYVWI